jgi:membrane peptidoglycan carboxypeptidase
VAKKPSHSRKLSVYSNLSHTRKAKKDAEARKRAQYLASLPKHPVKRLIYRLHPQRVAAFWFSKRGLIMGLKVLGVIILLLLLLVGGLFAYFRKDLDSIQPDQLAKSVQSTVNTYLDRNGNVLWTDTGGGNYKLVVPSDDLSDYLKHATVAIEDKNFYTEGGVSPSGLLRAVFNNVGGGSTQGGSTLTQQLVKQVFFGNDDTDRGLSGIPRKIKEVILSVEVERMYDKDQILSLYLNESPYGGPRNGAESGAETYFGVSAKDLTLPEAALLAAIPQDPNYFNPYNIAGNDDLIARQHTVLDDMAAQGYITQAQDTAAKAFPIIDSIKPESNEFSNIKAPWFVEYVRSQLISQLGASVVGQGGLTIKTTLDLNIQNELETAMATEFNSGAPKKYGFSNGAATVEDTQTGQIVAMQGSYDYNAQGYGQVNAATAYIQPGSTIKPLVYAQLFQQKATGAVNFGSGSKLINNTIDQIYGATLGNANGDPVNNGAVTIRTALANSWNIPAVEAMAIDGVSQSIKTIRAMGGTSYCTVGPDTTAQLSSAIGGCGIEQVDLVNAYATLGRSGVYKPQSSILEVTNGSGQAIEKWTDTVGTQVVSPQAAYVVSDILHDDNARTFVGTHRTGMYIPGVDSAAKTGTSNAANAAGSPKDIWMVNYSQTLTMAVWLGNPDTTPLNNNATSIVPGQILDTVLQYAYKTDYQAAGKWKPGDWIAQPAGIQRLGCSTGNTLVTGNGKFDQACGDVYPSYWSANQGLTNVNFDSVTKKLSTSCTPSGATVSEQVIKIPLVSSFTPDQALYIDPLGTYTLAGSEADGSSDCSNASASNLAPTLTAPTYSGTAGSYVVSATATASGSNTVTSVTFSVGGKTYPGVSQSNNVYTADLPSTVVVAPTTSDFGTVVDSAGQQQQTNFASQ